MQNKILMALICTVSLYISTGYAMNNVDFIGLEIGATPTNVASANCMDIFDGIAFCGTHTYIYESDEDAGKLNRNALKTEKKRSENVDLDADEMRKSEVLSALAVLAIHGVAPEEQGYTSDTKDQNSKIQKRKESARKNQTIREKQEGVNLEVTDIATQTHATNTNKASEFLEHADDPTSKEYLISIL